MAEETQGGGEPQHVPVRQGWYRTIIGIYIAVLAALLYGGVVYDLLWLVVAAEVLHIIASWRVLTAKQLGGIVGFGMPLKIPHVGLNFVLFGIMQLVPMSRNPHQKQFPDEPERVFHGDDKTPLPVLSDGTTMSRPIRIITGKARPEGDGEGQYSGPLNIQATVKMTGTVRYTILNFFDLWTRFPGDTAEEIFDEVDRQLQDTYVDVCKREWQTRPLGMIVDDDKVIEATILVALRNEVRSWGIRIDEVNLYPPDGGHDLNKELTRIGEEKAKKEQAREKADADLYTARQEAAAKLVRENADTEAAANRARELGMTGREVIGWETIHDMIKPTDKVILGASGIAEMATIGTAVFNAIKDMSPAPTPAAKGEGETK